MLLQRLYTGRPNNVDLRGDGPGGALVAATDRSARDLALFRLQADAPALTALPGQTSLDLDDPYGLCLHRSADGALQAFANDTNGRVVQVLVELDDDGARLTPQSAWQMGSKTEGCVVDDARGLLWLGEEPRGIWRGWPRWCRDLGRTY